MRRRPLGGNAIDRRTELMFGKRKHPDEPGEKKAPAESPAEARRPPELPRTSPVPGRRGSGIMQPGISRRPSLGSASALAATPAAGTPGSAANEGRKLVVGREICLSGEIKACERLIVEGRVEADLTDSKLLEITEHGLFKGNASVDNCYICGTFEGDLVVHGLLHIRDGGRVLGKVFYSELEVARGGKIIGTMEVIELEEAAEKPVEANKPDKAAAEAQSDKAEKDAGAQDSGKSAQKEAKSAGTTKMTKAEPEPAPVKAEPRGIRDLLDDPSAKSEPDKAAGPQAG